MTKAVQWLRSLVFVIQIYVMMALIGLVFSPWAVMSPKGARAACKLYCHWVFWTARWMVGLRGEVRGPIPTGEVIIAAKHQSFFDIMLIFDAVPQAKFIMKRELLWTPIIGLYAKRLGCVPVNRGKRGAAIAKMVKDVAAEFQEPGQLIIYPQGTRVAPGDFKPYKVGSAVLYEELNSACVPAATNVGLVWPRKGIMRNPGVGVVEFLDAIEPGMPRGEFMQTLEAVVEGKTDQLLAEAGYVTDGIR